MQEPFPSLSYIVTEIGTSLKSTTHLLGHILRAPWVRDGLGKEGLWYLRGAMRLSPVPCRGPRASSRTLGVEADLGKRMPINRWLLCNVVLVAMLGASVALSFLRGPGDSEEDFRTKPLTFPHRVATVSGLDLWLTFSHGHVGYQLTCARAGSSTDVQVGIAGAATGTERLVAWPTVECSGEPSLIGYGQVPELDEPIVGHTGSLSLAAQPDNPNDISKVVIGFYRGNDGLLYEDFGGGPTVATSGIIAAR